MSTTNDTDITKLNLNSTFYDWYLKTNQIIDYLNPVTVYDVFAGSGLRETRTGTPGTIELSVGTIPSLYGIDTVLDTEEGSTLVLAIQELAAKTVNNTSLFVFSDGGDPSFKVAATNMLPPTIAGNHTFTGTITVGDLIINDGSIVLNNTGTNRDNAGIIIESVADGSGQNTSFTYDTDTSAWYSNRNLGLKSGYSFVTDSASPATYPFYATSAQGFVDIRLTAPVSTNTEIWSIRGQWGSPDTLTFAHYRNSSLVRTVLTLNGEETTSTVAINDKISIGNVVGSTPFTQTPLATNIPITDSTNGFLNNFVNRVKLTNADGGILAGHMVRMSAAGLVRAGADTEANSAVLGIVESVSSGSSTVIISGPSVQPRSSNETIINPLTVGALYYLVQSASNGGVTTTKPLSGVVKPVGIATSATVLTMIPDHAVIGAVTSAFNTIQVTDTGESITAISNDTLSLVGGSYIDLDINTNRQIIINSSITANQLIPSASNYSVYGKQTGSPTGITLSPYSVFTRPLDGNISSVVIEPGALLGRKDDGSNSNNPIESLNSGEVLDLLGFSGNNYFNEITFLTSGSTEVHAFNASTSENFNIKAGNNVTFTYDSGSNSIVINAVDFDTDLELSLATVSDTETEVTNATNIIFSDAGFIDFTVTDGTSGTATITGTTKTNFQSFGTTSGNIGSFTPGKTVLINGNDGIQVNHSKSSTSDNVFTLSLANTINYREVQSDNKSFVINTLSYPGLLTLSTKANDHAEFLSNPAVYEVQMSITHFDNIVDSSFTRVSPEDYFSAQSDLIDKCVSVFADYVPTTGTQLVSYPFKFHKIIASEIDVEDINITGIAIKNFAEITNLSGELTTVANLSNGSYNKIRIQSDSNSYGTALEFTDNNSTAYIIKRTSQNSPVNNNGGLAIQSSLSFTNNGQTFSPSFNSFGNASTINVYTSDSAICQFKFDTNSSNEAFLGMDSTGAFMKFSSDSTNNQTVLFKLADNSQIQNATSFSLLNGNNYGWKFQTEQATTADIGKSVIVESVTGGVAKIGKHFVVQPYTTNTAITNAHPINTLYYVV